MPEGSGYGRILPGPSGFKHLGRMGPSKSMEQYFLYPFAWRDVVFVFDDFNGGGQVEINVTDFNEGLWVGDTNANGTEFEVKATNIVNGAATGATGAFDPDTVAIWGDAVWLGDQNAGVEFRYKINNIDNIQWEAGFSDPLSDEKETAINDIDTPTVTNGAADVAIFAQDTGQTLTTMAFVTDGSTANMNTTKTDLGTRVAVNNTYQGFRVQLDGNSSFAFVMDENGAVVESTSHGSLIGSQIEGGVLVRPRMLFEALTTSARTIDLDFIAAWQDRA